MGLLADKQFRDDYLARLRGYGGLLAGGVAGEIPSGLLGLLEFVKTGDINKGVAAQEAVQGAFMPDMNQQVQSDMQGIVPLIEDAGDINDFKINVPRMNVTIDNRLSGGDESFINIIRRLDSSDLIVIKFIYVNSDGQSSADFFYSTRDQCEYDFLERTVKIDAKHPLKYGQIGFGQEFFTLIQPGELTIGSGGQANPVYLVSDLIKSYLNSLSEPRQTIYESSLYPEVAYGDLNNGDDLIVYNATGIGTILDDDDFDTATQQLKRLSLTEAAIVGNVLGYAYYMPRFSKDGNYRASLTADNFLELEMDVSFRDVRQLSLDIDIAPNGSGITYSMFPIVEQSINPLAVNDIIIAFDTPPSIVGAEKTSSGPEDFDFQSIVLENLSATYASNIVSAYKKIFRVSDPPTATNPVDAGVMISGKILGIETLKPYEHFSVSSTDPLVDGKTFRPSYLKYSLKNDTIEFEAYEF